MSRYTLDELKSYNEENIRYASRESRQYRPTFKTKKHYSTTDINVMSHISSTA